MDRRGRSGRRHRPGAGRGRRAEDRQRPPRHRDEPGPVAYLLFQHVLRHDPADDQWLGRDRFVLSCGHTSLTLYIQLYLSRLRPRAGRSQGAAHLGLATPGHPEYRHTRGVEITTGPLGQGLGAAVGMAMAPRRERGLLDPDAAPGESPFDHHVYVLASDGDLMEGVASEARSLAGHQQLGNLIVIYDHNHISIEDDTDISFSEDVAARYPAYGWHVQDVDWGRAARATTSRTSTPCSPPSRPGRRPRSRRSWSLRTSSAGPPRRPAEHRQGPRRRPRRGRGRRDQGAPRLRPRHVLPRRGRGARPHPARSADGAGVCTRRGRATRHGATGEPERAALLDRLLRAGLPEGWTDALPEFPADPKGMATRKASGDVLTALAPVLPELWGGSADLAGSNNTTMDGEPSFVPKGGQTAEWRAAPTAAPCTSASASTPWARSSTASPCRA